MTMDEMRFFWYDCTAYMTMFGVFWGYFVVLLFVSDSLLYPAVVFDRFTLHLAYEVPHR